MRHPALLATFYISLPTDARSFVAARQLGESPRLEIAAIHSHTAKIFR
jgi:hypothetical protein